ncbi:hypothetical protein PR048_005748, partial [Dryococelus australis]
MIYIDMFGLIPQSGKANTCLFILIKASAIAAILVDKIFKIFGSPEHLILDNASYFVKHHGYIGKSPGLVLFEREISHPFLGVRKLRFSVLDGPISMRTGFHAKLKVGDIVLYRKVSESKKRASVSAKLALPYHGPYEIQGFFTPVTVELVDPSNKLTVRKACVSAVKFYSAKKPEAKR